jgi:uncharacterized membrane protein YgdD (TMEM256/DUF423 family)
MTWRLDLWDRFQTATFWWMHAMVCLWLLFAFILLFSGSLYALSISGIRTLGAITPLGGTAFILAWFLLACHLFRGR